MRAGTFRPVSSLDQLGFKVAYNAEDIPDLRYFYGRVTSTSPVPGAEFGQGHNRLLGTNAVFFEAAGCRRITLRDVDEMQAEILWRDKAGSWDNDHDIVTEGVAATTYRCSLPYRFCEYRTRIDRRSAAERAARRSRGCVQLPGDWCARKWPET